ncbi:MAG: exopolysaccharide biosynthesis polyprenyl glycosylphosphotransferase [Verrucomicrobiales bacterium]|jgi:exopolysaccharide biosynthesis polyprenyl glycosylphosphotransferase
MRTGSPIETADWLEPPSNTAASPNAKPASVDTKTVSSSLERRSLAAAAKPLLDRFGGTTWLAVDMFVAAIAVSAAYWLSPFSSEAYAAIGHLDPIRCAVIYAALIAIFGRICGLQDTLQNRHEWNVLAKTALVVSLAILGLAAISMWVYYMKIGRYILGLSAIASGFGLYATRILIWRLAKDHCQRVCFIGSKQFCGAVREMVNSQARPVETLTIHLPEGVDKNSSQAGLALNQNGSESSFTLSQGIAQAGRDESEFFDLQAWAKCRRIDEIVVHGHAPSYLQAKLLRCLDEGIHVTGYPEYVERNYSCVPVSEIDHEWFLSADIESLHPYYRVLKRLSDILIAAIGLVLTAPILGIAALLIWIEDRGPIFYRQVRVGERNRRFEILKLRSMRVDAETEGAQWAKEKDRRATRIGLILRRTRIDEIPQFLNILNGDMAFIGPRPERPEFVEMLAEQIPFYGQRHLVKPGLTGWAQISHTYGGSVADALEKLKYDLYYVKYANLELDIHIVIRTIGAVMKGSR